APSVSDTHWAGSWSWSNGEHRTTTVWFRPDGVVVYAYGGTTYDNGRWRQRGPLVMWDSNDLFALDVGFEDGDEMQGRGYSVSRATGQWSLRRVGAPPPEKGGR